MAREYAGLMIGGVQMPKDVAYSVKRDAIDSRNGSGTAADGTGFTDRIALKETLNVEFGFLSSAQVASVTAATDAPYVTVTYWSPFSCAMRTVQMSRSDIEPAIVCVLEDGSCVWDGMKLHLEER